MKIMTVFEKISDKKSFVWLFIQTLFVDDLDDFFPFGPDAGDTKIPIGDDNCFGPIALSHRFPYFGTDHSQIFQSTNGLFTFLAPMTTYTPITFPINNGNPGLTAFWSDIDTRSNTSNSVDNSVYHQVYTRTSSDTESTRTIFSKTTELLQRCLLHESIFEPRMIIVGTWLGVGAYSNKTDRRNTFQLILATDSSRSFAFFLYKELQWASPGYTTEPFAQAGFNAGDGVTGTML